MASPLVVGFIRASLPRYFPERYGVFEAAEAALEALCAAEGARLFTAPTIPMDAHETQGALDACLAAGADFVLVLHGGFTMGDVARTIAAAPVRAGFWSTPEPRRTGDVQLNNFVSLNMALSIARLVRDTSRNPVQWYHGAPDSPVLVARLRTTIRALAADKALRGRRIGSIGGLAMTFFNMEVSTNALRARLGVEVAHHDMAEMVGRMKAMDAARVDAEVAAMRSRAEVVGVSDAQMSLTGRAALALRDIAVTHDYAALTCSDWPSLQDDPGMYPGAAFSWLEEVDGVPVASEGDILGAVTQLVAKAVTGRVGYLLDMTEPDLDSGKLLMWHGGGGPLYLASQRGVRWINHPMIGRGTEAGATFGAIADLEFAPGPVTVFRIAREGACFFLMGAQVVQRDPSGFDGCRGWLDSFTISERSASLEDVVATVMAHGIEHHFVLVPGTQGAVVAEYAAWMGMAELGYRPMADHLTVG